MHLPAASGSGRSQRLAKNSSGSGGRRVQVLVGSRRLMDEQGVELSGEAVEWARAAEGRGHTCAFVAGDDRLVMGVGCRDYPVVGNRVCLHSCSTPVHLSWNTCMPSC